MCTTPVIAVESIVDAIAQTFNTTEQQMKGQKRQRHLVIPRQAAMFLMRKNTARSLEEIGDLFGQRDHTTVLHAVRKTQTRIDTDTDFARLMEFIQGDLDAKARQSMCANT